MAKEYKVGEKYYLPVTINNIYAGHNYPICIEFVDSNGRDTSDTICIADDPDLLLTAEDIALVINTERDEALAELKSRNAELEALLKEVMATRDEAIKQNNELIADRNNWKEAAQRYHDNAKVADAAADELRKENKELKSKVAENADTISRLSANKVSLTEEVGKLRETVADRTIDVQHLTEENAKLKTDLDQRNKDFWAMKKDRDELDSIGGKLRAENENLKAELDQRNKDFDAMKKDRDTLLAENKRTTAYYMEANRTASEAAEANDELKAKIADLRNSVGEQLAQIQDLNAEVHFHKEFGEGLAKQQEELQARYDELDSVNKEQAEKIRKLDKRNKYLESEKNRKPIVHVLTNDGHVYAFTSSGKVSVKYHTEHNILMIEDGEKAIAGFVRGDKPGNLSAWWTG